MNRTLLLFVGITSAGAILAACSEDVELAKIAGDSASAASATSSSSTTGSTSTSTSSSSTGSTSTSGGGGDACSGLTCNTPDAPACVSATTLRTSTSPGTCTAGTCNYPFTDTECPSACVDGACKNVTPVLLSAGYDHTCAINPSGALKCWGYGNYGQLGQNMLDSHVPVGVMGLSSGVLAVAAGHERTCAIAAAGAAKCWGNNDSGALGNDSIGQSPVPVDVIGLSSGVLAISTGFQHSCAVTGAGALKCWGDNSHGQLGNESTVESHVPVNVLGLSSGVASVSAGDGYTCAVTSAGALKCWGDNILGELGDGTTTERHLPVDVMGLSASVVSVSTTFADGLHHTCATLSAGSVMCWGNNNTGQLGNGFKNVSSSVPVSVPSTFKALAVSAGGISSCAVDSGGLAKCWGINDKGQLGNGSTDESDVPADVVGLSSVVTSISSSDGHACALTLAGSVECWGDNTYGQLGDGTSTESHVPVAVVGF